MSALNRSSNVAALPDDAMLSLEIRTKLKSLYADPARHYHDLAHIEALLALARTHANLIADPEALEAAIWFHDAIYDARRKDNEAKSARLARAWLVGDFGAEQLVAVVLMIEATATHEIPTAAAPGLHADIAAFLDMDLAILGASAPVFDAYEAAIRREYDFVPEEAWRTRRGNILRRFLDRPAIFKTDRFRDLFEQPARQNLTRSLARLA